MNFACLRHHDYLLSRCPACGERLQALVATVVSATVPYRP